MKLGRRKLLTSSANLALLVLILQSAATLFWVFYLHKPTKFLVAALLVCAALWLLQLVLVFGRQNYRLLCILLGSSVVILVLSSLAFQSMLRIDAIDVHGRSSLQYVINAFGVCVLWMIAGAAVQAASIKTSTPISFFILIAMMTMIAYNLDGGLVISYGRLANEGSIERLNHLMVGDSSVFLLFLSYAVAGERLRIVVFGVALAILFSLGGRSALIGFAIAVTVLRILSGRHLKSVLATAVVSGFAGLLVMVAAQKFGDDHLFQRMTLLGGVSSDGSFQERVDQFLRAFSYLPAQAAIGDTSVIVEEFGSIGSYMHNILSAWQMYGVTAFLAIGACLAFCAKYVIKNIAGFSTPVNIFGSGLLLYVLLCVVTSKSVNFYLLWFVLGFWLARMATSEPLDRRWGMSTSPLTGR